MTSVEEPNYGKSVQGLLEDLGQVGGVKVKREVILKFVEDSTDPNEVEVLQRALKYAYDDFIRFGVDVGKIAKPLTRPAKFRNFDLWVFDVLDEVIAVSGNRAKIKRESLIVDALSQLDADGANLMVNILNKDLRCGINESTIRKVFPGLLEEFDVMLAKPFVGKKVDSWPVFVEPKLDGLRAIAVVGAGRNESDVTFYTRSGRPITTLDNFKAEMAMLARQFPAGQVVTLDGEVTAGEFLESMSSVRKKDEQITKGTFHIFDVLLRGGKTALSLSNEELKEQGTQRVRRQKLMLAWAALTKEYSPEFLTLVPSYIASNEEEVFQFYHEARLNNVEGLIVKDPNGVYSKTRSPAWMKMKACETLDLPIVGAFEGNGQFAGRLGGLIVMHGEVEVRVGGGFSDQQRTDFWEEFQRDLQRIKDGERENCRLIDVPAEVSFQEIMPSGSLRHPVFVKLRFDKSTTVGNF